MIPRASAWRLAGRWVLLSGSLLAVLGPWASASAGHAIQVVSVEPPALHVIPFPGTPDASRRSEIIFSSLQPSDIASVLVIGSSTGQHAGQVSALPDHAGTAFLPKTPFAPGEAVAVRAVLTSAQAGTASGDLGATALHFSFTVANADSGSAALAKRTVGATRSNLSLVNLHSKTGLHPPPVVATGNPDRSSGEIFVTTQESGQGSSQVGPMILNSQGKVVWFRPTRATPYNLQVQRYRGQRVLTWWQGVQSPGEDLILNQSYGTIGVVRGAEQYNPDLHEFQITPQGTALVDSYSVVRRNLSTVGGPVNGRVIDYIVQDLDIRTGKLLWEWHALGHVPLTASYRRPSGSTPFDFFHLNAIQQLPDGDLLISSRNTWAIYRVSRQTGKVVWKLGGKHSSFKMGPGTGFEWQHDARLTGRILTLFDDGDWPEEEPQSSAKALRIDQHTRTAVLLRRYTHAPPLLAPKAGSMQILPNGNVFVGWGGTPDFSEYTPSGKQTFNASFPLYTSTYRAFRFAWTGQPHTLPSLALTRSSWGLTRAYVSWNGATRVTRWRLMGGSAPNALSALQTARWSGFETAMTVHHAPGFLCVQALDGHGHVLGTSRIVSGPSR